MRTLNGFVAGLAVMTVGLWSGGMVAHAATTTEIRVVSTFRYEDATGVIVNPGSGWAASSDGTGKVEIGSAYGAPSGLGRSAIMLDTPANGDHATVTALTEQPGYYSGAFPEAITVTADRHLGFWLYLSNTAAPGSSPVLEAWVALGNATHVIITFDPIANGYATVGTWMYVDTTAAGATWTVRPAWSTDPSLRTTMTWQDVVVQTALDVPNYGTMFGTFDYGFQFLQQAPGSSAIDGVTVSTVPGSTTTNFELQTASSRPQLDDCKNNGWQTHPSGPFKNQGACIAAIVATH